MWPLELFDAEKDCFPYADGYFSTVLCCELVEHLTEDPMHMMAEINRILRPGGCLVLTTPNIGSLRAIAAILAGYHPGFFPAYIRPRVEGEEPEARHNREYTAREIVLLFHYAGFEITLLETGAFRNEPKPEHEWVKHLLDRYEQCRPATAMAITYAVGSVKLDPFASGTPRGYINERRVSRCSVSRGRLRARSLAQRCEQVARNVDTREFFARRAVLRSAIQRIHRGRRVDAGDR